MVGQTNSYAKRRRSYEDSITENGNKKRKSDDGMSLHATGTKEIVYRYLCPGRKVGRVIGRGGQVVRKLMVSSEARILIGERIPGCEERLITIYSSGDQLNTSEDTDLGMYLCPAQDALFKVHERVVESDMPGHEDAAADSPEISARLLVPSDQMGHIIGKRGQTIHSIRNDTETSVCILKNEQLPPCANSYDELIQITGEVVAVKKALFRVTSSLYEHSFQQQHLQDETVFRLLCRERIIGSVIGKGGEIVRKLRADTQAKIKIDERVPDSDERVVTISSSSEKTNVFGDNNDNVCAAQDALFRLYERLVMNGPSDDEDAAAASHATVRLLVPCDQVGHIIGKGGHVIQELRSNSGASIHILKDKHLPPCARSSDELLQITGLAPDVMKALVQVSSCLRDRPSHSQSLSAFGDFQTRLRHGEHSSSHTGGDGRSSKLFALSLLCPASNIARVIGKDGNIINRIRQQSGASIKVDSSTVEDDCTISISGKEFFEDPVSSTIDAAVRLQPKCSEMTDRGHGEPLYITQLLVPSSQIGCLIGKGGSVITAMRRATQANIRIMSKDSCSKVVSEDEVLVQISGEIDAARTALVQISTRLKAHVFGKESALSENCEDDCHQGGGSSYHSDSDISG